MAIIMDGKKLAQKIRNNLKIECEELKSKGIINIFSQILLNLS